MVLVLQLLWSLVVFLFPLGLYALFLAYLNRSRRPLLVPGQWDSLGLLLGLSGFFLYTMPSLLQELYRRAAGSPASDGPDFTQLWARWWLLWMAYFLMLVAGAAYLVSTRRHKTMIYNVDTDLFGHALAHALRALGLGSSGPPDRLTIAPLPPGELHAAQTQTAVSADKPLAVPPGPAPDPAHAGTCVVAVDPFPALSHVTLHWDDYAPRLRRDVEAQLARSLENARPVDNGAAGWFLAASALAFGVIIMIAAFFIFLVLFARRG